MTAARVGLDASAVRGWPRRRATETVRIAALSGFTLVVVLAPLWFLFVNSAKPLNEANQLGAGLPKHWQLLHNYRTVLDQGKLLAGAVNTLIIGVPAIVIICLFSAASAWVFVRRASRWVNVIYLFSISGVLLPPMIVTTIFMLKRIGMYGSYAGITLFYVGSLSSLAIFLISGFVRTIPVELEEAARIDGASNLRVFFSIVFPLLRPAMFTTSVFLFLFIWSDLLYQFFLIGGRGKDTLSIGLYNFVQVRQYETAWNLVFSDVLLVSLPPLLVYFVAQRRILSGLTAGAVNR